MIFPWNRVFEHFRDRSRGALFFCGLAVVLGSMAGLGILELNAGEGAVDGVLAAMAGVMVVFWLLQIALWVRRARKRRGDRYKIAPLSRDEICKARSKLMQKR